VCATAGHDNPMKEEQIFNWELLAGSFKTYNFFAVARQGDGLMGLCEKQK